MESRKNKKSLAQLEVRTLNKVEIKHIKGGSNDQVQDVVIIDIIAP